MSNCKVTTLAGTGKKGHRDGKATAEVTFGRPRGLAVDTSGNIIVADTQNNCIRKITPTGLASTLAGSGEEGHRNGVGRVTQFAEPTGVAVDKDNNIYVADKWNHCIRKISPLGIVSTLAGSGEQGLQNGAGTTARFYCPCGVAIDTEGNVLVADEANHCIRKVSAQGLVSTLAGTSMAGHRDGIGAEAQFNTPCGITVDRHGSIIVADKWNHRIRKISPAGMVSTLAGSSEMGLRDGSSATAQFYCPCGVAEDTEGNIVVADEANNCIRKVSPRGLVSTIGGSGAKSYQVADGMAAEFRYPYGVAIDKNGHILVSDSWNCQIRCVSTSGDAPYNRSGAPDSPMLPPSDAQVHRRNDMQIAAQVLSVIFATGEFSKEMQKHGLEKHTITRLKKNMPINSIPFSGFDTLLEFLYWGSCPVIDGERCSDGNNMAVLEVLFELAFQCEHGELKCLYDHCIRQITSNEQNTLVMGLVQEQAGVGRKICKHMRQTYGVSFAEFAEVATSRR